MDLILTLESWEPQSLLLVSTDRQNQPGIMPGMCVMDSGFCLEAHKASLGAISNRPASTSTASKPEKPAAPLYKRHLGAFSQSRIPSLLKPDNQSAKRIGIIAAVPHVPHSWWHRRISPVGLCGPRALKQAAQKRTALQAKHAPCMHAMLLFLAALCLMSFPGAQQP